MGKEPCENCGLTNYNTIRKCYQCERGKGIQKFGCDHCFKSLAEIGGGNDSRYYCPTHSREISSGLRILSVLLLIVAFCMIVTDGEIVTMIVP